MTTKIQVIKDDLQSIAVDIRLEHDLCRKSIAEGLQHAINAGELLLRAKELCPHGTWGAWLRDNCNVSERTAQTYMRVARGLPVLEAKAQRVADLSLRDAVEILEERNLGDLEKAQRFSAEFDRLKSRWEIMRIGLEEVIKSPSSSIQQVKAVMDIAEQHQNDFAELIIRAERQAGRLMNEIEAAGYSLEELGLR